MNNSPDLKRGRAQRAVFSRESRPVRDAASRTVGNVMNTASERASELAEQARDTADVVRRRVSENPVPAALTAMLLGWVAYKAMTRNGSSGRPYNARWRDMPEPGSGSREWMSDTSASVRNRVNSTTRRAAGEVGRIFRQNPLAVAVAAAAVGVAIGLSVPETETENRMLGETRDAVLDRAREAVAHPMER